MVTKARAQVENRAERKVKMQTKVEKNEKKQKYGKPTTTSHIVDGVLQYVVATYVHARAQQDIAQHHHM